MDDSVKIQIDNLSFAFGRRTILKDITVSIREHEITSIVGPSGQGKSTLLTVLNRLWENTPGARMKGNVRIRFNEGWKDIYSGGIPVHVLRQKVGMVFQTPNPFPMSIYKNVAFPLKLSGKNNASHIEALVEKALTDTFLWHEVEDRLKEDARTLSGGQQQRLCIARALVLKPEVLLLDEPTSSLDTRSGRIIEDLLVSLQNRCTLVMVSHYQDQVRRVAGTVLEMEDGRLVNGVTHGC